MNHFRYNYIIAQQNQTKTFNCPVPYIFDRFYKESSEQNKNGSGLGLPIAKQIAERHNIIIKCESNAHDYTVFSFIFSQNS